MRNLRARYPRDTAGNFLARPAGWAGPQPAPERALGNAGANNPRDAADNFIAAANPGGVVIGAGLFDKVIRGEICAKAFYR